MSERVLYRSGASFHCLDCSGTDIDDKCTAKWMDQRNCFRFSHNESKTNNHPFAKFRNVSILSPCVEPKSKFLTSTALTSDISECGERKTRKDTEKFVTENNRILCNAVSFVLFAFKIPMRWFVHVPWRTSATAQSSQPANSINWTIFTAISATATNLNLIRNLFFQSIALSLFAYLCWLPAFVKAHIQVRVV